MAFPLTGHLTLPALSLIKEMEACRLDAYRDAVGVWTIGYGHTRGVRPGMTITQAQANRYLTSDVKVAQKDISRSVKVPLTNNEYGALVSLVFNIGGTAFKRSTCLSELNRGNRQAAADAMELFVKGRVRGRKRVLNGLVRRRRLERALFETKHDVPHKDGRMDLGGETILVSDKHYDTGRHGLQMAPVAITPGRRTPRNPQLRRKLRRSAIVVGAGGIVSAAPLIASAGFPGFADQLGGWWQSIMGGETAPSQLTVLDWVSSGFTYADMLWQRIIKSDAVTWVMSELPAKYGSHDLGAAMTDLQGFVAAHPVIVWTAIAIIVVFGRRLLRRVVRTMVPIIA